ncbi:MAG TPA: redoxin family protein [Burkholderiaceae bacterium]|nr:redoxin family protein [Burkholderiaceae bacterium]
MSPRRRFLAFAMVGLLGLATGLAVAWWRHAERGATASAAPLFQASFPDVMGQEQALAQWKGRVLVVNFWATWCPPCVKEMPDLQTVAQEYRERGVTVIGLAIDNPKAVAAFREQHGITLPLLVAGAGGSELGRQLGNQAGALPYTILIDRKGRIVQSRMGQVDAAQLRLWLDAQL